MIPSINSLKRAAAYMQLDIKELEYKYRMLDKIGLNRESVECSNAMCDLMTVHQMLLEMIERREDGQKLISRRNKKRSKP